MFDLKRFRQAYGLTQKEFAEILSCKQPNISAIEKSNKDLEPSQIEALIKRYGNENLNVFISHHHSSEQRKDDEIQLQDSLSDYETWLLPQKTHGGSLTNIPADSVFLQNCEKIVSPIKGVDFAISVYGDSMAPEYPSGSRVLIKKINPDAFIDWGKAYVLDTCNGVILKEVLKCEREGFVTCHSINPDPKFADFDLSLNDVYGIYRVLMCLSAK